MDAFVKHFLETEPENTVIADFDQILNGQYPLSKDRADIIPIKISADIPPAKLIAVLAYLRAQFKETAHPDTEIVLYCSDYDLDPRDLWEIPEICEFAIAAFRIDWRVFHVIDFSEDNNWFLLAAAVGAGAKFVKREDGCSGFPIDELCRVFGIDVVKDLLRL